MEESSTPSSTTETLFFETNIKINLRGNKISSVFLSPQDSTQPFLALLYSNGFAEIHSLQDFSSVPLEIGTNSKSKVLSIGNLTAVQDSSLFGESILAILFSTEKTNSSELELFQLQSDGKWESFFLTLENVNEINEKETTFPHRLTLQNQVLHPSFISFGKDCFVGCSSDLSLLWVWRLIKIGESVFKVKLIQSISLSSNICSILITSFHLIVGEESGIRYWILDDFLKPKQQENIPIECSFFQIILNPKEPQSIGPIIELQNINNSSNCILAKNAEGLLFGIQLELSIPQLIHIKFPFPSIEKLSILTKFSNRSDGVTISGNILFTCNPYSLYIAPFKEVIKSLESSTLDSPSFSSELAFVEIKSKSCYISSFPIQFLGTFRPDLVFIGNQNNLSLLLISHQT